MSDPDDDDSGAPGAADSHTCKWGTCRRAFDTAEVLDKHAQKAAAAASKEGDKGVVCEWEACVSDKIYRDSWNLVTHVRYKHTHFKPFVCTHDGCGKRFVQLHQMKKHTKTPHSGSAKPRPDKKRRRKSVDPNDDGGIGAAAGASDFVSPPVLRPRPSRRSASRRFAELLDEDADPDDDEYMGGMAEPHAPAVVAVAVAPTTFAPAYSSAPLPAAVPRRQVDVPLTTREEEAAKVLEQVRFSPVPPEMLMADGPTFDIASPSRLQTPMSSFTSDRAHGVVSPTSLLASNTHWQSIDSSSTQGRSSLWSPLPEMGSDHRHTPTELLAEPSANARSVGFIPIQPVSTAPGTVSPAPMRPIPSTDGRLLRSPPLHK